MSKKSLVQRNAKRERLISKYSNKRQELKAKIRNTEISPEERFEAVLKLAKLPRNSSTTRYRLRCELTGRPRGNYRQFGICRNKFRELASRGQIPGVIKASW